MPAPRIVSAVREPEYPRHLRRIAAYGPLEVHYSHDEDCDNYDALKYTIMGQESPIAAEIAEAFMKAHKITLRELIEDAPEMREA
ncbi:hypothetical protein WJU23_05355 [Prosthecobacter sp. SYSU 5D2]|uniref:hypothetical protein n=1 Tax=Prosthecobacter sp. SYSU 5D2 TaxID=3134134 RepID=UPI0031FE8DA5